MNKSGSVSIALKYEFKYYVGMARPTDQETIVMEKIEFSYSQIPKRRGHTMWHRATAGSIGVSQDTEEWEENASQSLYCVASREGMGDAGLVGFGLVSLNSFSGLGAWGFRVPWDLALGQ